MGKKKIAKGGSSQVDKAKVTRALSKTSKKKLPHAVLHVQSTYNNTRVLLTNPEGGALAASSSGALGFKGAKKGTPYAAGKVGELIAEQAGLMGVKDVDVVVRGVGAGRDAAVRSFVAKGIGITSISDKTPVPFNGPRLRKARRV